MSNHHYKIVFKNIGDKQKDFLKSHFDDYSWGPGLSTEEVDFQDDAAGFTATFDSTKALIVDDDDESEDNIYHALVGKGQFFSNIYYQFLDDGIDTERVEILFLDDEGETWDVGLSKWSSMEPVEAATNASDKKSYVLTDPEGNEHHTDNLTAFCRERDLWPNNMRKVAQGKSKSAQGWTCRYAE